MFFAARKSSTAFAGDGVESERIGSHEARGIGCFEGGPEFIVAGIVFREQEVFAHGGVEEEAFLRHIAELIAQPFLGNFLQRYAVDEDAAAAGFVETGEEVEHGGFPRSRGADEGDRLAGQGFEREAFDRRRVFRVVEGDMFEAHMAADRFRAQAFGEVAFVGCIDDAEDAFGRDHTAGEGLRKCVDARNRIEEETPCDEE